MRSSRTRERYGRAAGIYPDLDEKAYLFLPTLERRYRSLASHFVAIADPTGGERSGSLDALRLAVANRYIGEDVGASDAATVEEAMDSLWAAIDSGEIELNEAQPDLRALLALSVVIDKLQSYHLRGRQRSLFSLETPRARKGGTVVVARLRGAEVARARDEREVERRRLEEEARWATIRGEQRAFREAQEATKKARKAAEKKQTPKTSGIRVGDQFILAEVGVKVEVVATRKTGNVTKFQVQPASAPDRKKYEGAWWWGRGQGALGWLTVGQLRKLPGGVR